jgi:hypothetical protein
MHGKTIKGHKVPKGTVFDQEDWLSLRRAAPKYYAMYDAF